MLKILDAVEKGAVDPCTQALTKKFKTFRANADSVRCEGEQLIPTYIPDIGKEAMTYLISCDDRKRAGYLKCCIPGETDKLLTISEASSVALRGMKRVVTRECVRLVCPPHSFPHDADGVWTAEWSEQFPTDTITSLCGMIFPVTGGRRDAINQKRIPRSLSNFERTYSDAYKRLQRDAERAQRKMPAYKKLTKDEAVEKILNEKFSKTVRDAILKIWSK